MLMSSVPDQLAGQVLNGPFVVAALVSVLAGLVSFVSPCILPLVPGYVAYAAGEVGSHEDARRSRLVVGTLLFVAGFTVVFVAFGTAFGALGAWLAPRVEVVQMVAGVVMVVMGLVLAEVLPPLPGGWSLRWRPTSGIASAPVLGAVFAVGWAPCISPVLGAVLSLSVAGGSPLRGAALATMYCLGLGLPFVACAFAVGSGAMSSTWLKRHRLTIARCGAAVMVLVGVLLITGLWQSVLQAVQQVAGSYETWL